MVEKVPSHHLSSHAKEEIRQRVVFAIKQLRLIDRPLLLPDFDSIGCVLGNGNPVWPLRFVRGNMKVTKLRLLAWNGKAVFIKHCGIPIATNTPNLDAIYLVAATR